MADEIAQVTQLEFEGAKFVIKGGLQAAAWLGKALAALWRCTGEVGLEKFKNRAGERSMKALFKLGGNEPPVKIDIDEKYQQEFFEHVKAKKLHYCLTVDFDLTDGMTPILVTQKELPAFLAIKDAFMKRKIAEEEAALKEHGKELDEIQQKLLSANKEDIPMLEVKAENRKQAKEELEAILNKAKEDFEKKQYASSFAQYLSTAKGTEFEKDPDKAITEYEKGVVITREIEAKECMQPVRDTHLMPSSGMQYYLPDNGITIARSFHVEDGIVYSDYSLKTENGEIHEFSDKNVTKEKWNKEILPKMLDVAGIVESIKCKVFETVEQVKAYLQYFNKITPKSESKTVDFSQAEVVSEIDLAIQDALKGMASAKVDVNKIYFQVPQETLMAQNGKVIYAPDGVEGPQYLFDKIEPGNLDNGMISFVADKNVSVAVREKDRPEKTVTAETVKNIISEGRMQVTEAVKNMFQSGRSK